MPKSADQQKHYEQWLKDEVAPFGGWDFSYINDRHHFEKPDWNYEEMAKQLISGAASVLDIGTGGGEVLARLASFPEHAVAIEDWQPNVAVATKRLSPLGVKVLGVDYQKRLPFQDGEFDLILNRHSALPIAEISRILQPGGIFFTQQVDGHNLEDLAQEFGAKPKWPENTLSQISSRLTQAGFEVVDSKNWTGQAIFNDVGAIVYFLKNIPWTVEGFSVNGHLPYLERLQRKVDRGESLSYSIGRFLIRAVKGPQETSLLF
jgi:SAM-dependent methyltransferase